MLTPEIIRRHFTGPRCKGHELVWRWYQRGRRWPRTSFSLVYNPRTRRFNLLRFKKTSQRAKLIEENITLDEITVEGFRSCLTPADLARCAAASIAQPPGPTGYFTIVSTDRVKGVSVVEDETGRWFEVPHLQIGKLTS